MSRVFLLSSILALAACESRVDPQVTSERVARPVEPAPIDRTPHGAEHPPDLTARDVSRDLEGEVRDLGDDLRSGARRAGDELREMKHDVQSSELASDVRAAGREIQHEARDIADTDVDVDVDVDVRDATTPSASTDPWAAAPVAHEQIASVGVHGPFTRTMRAPLQTFDATVTDPWAAPSTEVAVSDPWAEPAHDIATPDPWAPRSTDVAITDPWATPSSDVVSTTDARGPFSRVMLAPLDSIGAYDPWAPSEPTQVALADDAGPFTRALLDPTINPWAAAGLDPNRVPMPTHGWQPDPSSNPAGMRTAFGPATSEPGRDPQAILEPGVTTDCAPGDPRC